MTRRRRKNTREHAASAKGDKKADDRGPFGAGAKVKFARSDATLDKFGRR